MDDKDLPFSSDESDADFIPKEEDYKSESGSEMSGSEFSGDEDIDNKNKKRKIKSKKGSKKLKKNEEKDIVNVDNEEKKKKIDIDALWADFKKDVNNIKSTSESSAQSKPSQGINSESENPKTKGILSLSSRGKNMGRGGGKIGSGSGLAKVLNQIAKKDKMSTLQKSQLDWNNFKKSEGIEEEIKTFNKGKDGYLEKQDFLQRTDLRQFEIEKDLRSTRRKF